MKRKVHKIYYHELVDRIAMVQGIIETELSSHVAAQRHNSILAKLEQAQEVLGEAYQLVAKLD